MPYQELHGNLFASKAQALVNTVNCVGFMGKGVALEFRRRFPSMFDDYKKVCLDRRLRPGQILPYRKSKPWVLNFAIKDDWKNPSKIAWVEECLEKFRQRYRETGLTSVAFPWMGAMNGGIPLAEIQRLTRQYLADLEDIEIEVYSFDPKAADPLFDELVRRSHDLSPEVFAHEAGMQGRYVEAIYALLRSNETTCLMDVVIYKVLKDADAVDRGRFAPPCGGTDFSGTSCTDAKCDHKGCAYKTLQFIELNGASNNGPFFRNLCWAAFYLAQGTKFAPWTRQSAHLRLVSFIRNAQAALAAAQDKP